MNKNTHNALLDKVHAMLISNMWSLKISILQIKIQQENELNNAMIKLYGITKTDSGI